MHVGLNPNTHCLSRHHHLYIKAQYHPISCFSSIDFVAHQQDQSYNKLHNTTNMPDQVKYANKLQGKNVLVIGGSSGLFFRLFRPSSPTPY